MLERVLLDDNNIKFMPKSIGSLKLKQLSLSNNKIEKLEDSLLVDLPDLETLWLNKNNLKELPVAIQNLPHLKDIKFEDNPLSMTKDWLEKIKKIAE